MLRPEPGRKMPVLPELTLLIYAGADLSLKAPSAYSELLLGLCRTLLFYDKSYFSGDDFGSSV